MGYNERKILFEEIETHRKRPLIAYVTSGRPNADGRIASDACREFVDQLEKLPKGTKELDVLINSYGGDGLASWRLISTIREILGEEGHVSCLVPHYAFSAGTLFAVGANDIFMHPMACLGPVDPQITVTTKDGSRRFAYEDLVAYGDFLREEGQIKGEPQKANLLQNLVSEIQPSVLGASKRSSSQSVEMAKRLLKMHMKGQAEKADKIAEKLNKSYFSHGHAVSRTEATSLGLNIADRDSTLEDLIWKVYVDFEVEMDMRETFDPLAQYLKDPGSKHLLEPPQHVSIPTNAPPNVQNQIWAAYLQNLTTHQGATMDWRIIQAAVESARHGSAFVTRGKIFAARKPDLEYLAGAPKLDQHWEKQPVV